MKAKRKKPGLLSRVKANIRYHRAVRGQGFSKRAKAAVRRNIREDIKRKGKW